MYRILRRVLCALCIPAAILGAVQLAGAATRTFFGSYELSHVVETGNNVDVTVRLVLHNLAGSDLRGAIVVVMDTESRHTLLGSFSSIKSVPSSGELTLTKTFTISAAEYERWKVGHDPVLEVLVPKGGGTSIEGIQADRVTRPGEFN